MMLTEDQFERVRMLVANGDCVYPCPTCNESGCDECEGTGNVEAHVLLGEFAKPLFHEVERLRAENEALKANAILMSEYRFATENIPTDGQGKPLCGKPCADRRPCVWRHGHSGECVCLLGSARRYAKEASRC